MWTWMSLEHIVDKLKAGSDSSRHERAITLMKNTQFRVCRDGDRLRKLLVNLIPEETHKTAVFRANASNVSHLLHYFICRELRNSIFHAPLTEIEPRNWDDEKPYNVQNDDRVARFRVGTRLILVIMQELLVSYLRRSPAKTDIDEEAENGVAQNGILSDVKLWRAMKFIHLAEPFSRERQFELGI